jgi:predicted HicB family RNase H-like nuclease
MLASETNGQHIHSILNGRNTTKKSITKSFRIDEDVIRKIEDEAKNNNISLNAEINNILRKYVDWNMLADKVGMT